LRVRWLSPALDDLDSAVEFIAQDDPRAAQEVAGKIWDATRRLSTHPGLGRPGRVNRTRELVVPGTPYIVPYRVREDTVEILRILHGAMRWPNRL